MEASALRLLVGSLALASAVAAAGCKRAEADPAKLDEAKVTFANVCSRCHGADGKGGIAAGTATPPRNFCDSAFHGSHTDEQLIASITNGKGGMPAFGAIYSPEQIAALVQVVRAFDPNKKKSP